METNETQQPTAQPAQVKKPFYKKWWFLTFVGIIVLAAFIPKDEASKKREAEIATITTNDKVAATPATAVNDVEKAKKEITEEIAGMKTLADQKYSSLEETRLGLAVLQLYQKNSAKYESLKGKDKELDKSIAAYKNSLSPVLKKQYPKLRAAYAEAMRTVLWENNIEVSHSGKTVKLVGGIFANNKNIQDTQGKLSEMLNDLRFKKVSYAWYDGADGSYYPLKTPDDGEIVSQ